MFEPTYDSYAAAASMAGATPRLVRLHPPDWHFDPDELAAAVGPRTKMVLLNSPHNPTGKVFSPDELAQVAALCRGPRPPGGDRRGLRAPGLRRVAHPAGHAPRHGRAHPHHLLGWQDVLLHRVEGGVGERPGAAGGRGAGGQAVPDLHQPRPVPAGHRPRPGLPARRHGPARRRARGQAGPALRRARRPGVRRVPARRHLLRHHRHRRRWLRA